MKMKLCLMLFGIMGAIHAINAQKEPVRIGLRAGLYSPSYKFSALPSSFTKIEDEAALYAGIQVDIPLAKKLSVIGELLYGIASIQAYSNAPNYIFHDEMSYLLVPALVKYKLGKVGLLAGLQGEFLLSAEGHYYDAQSNSIKIGDITPNSYKKFGVDGVLGAEWVFKYRFGIDARYQFGFRKANAGNAASWISENSNIKMNAFQTGIFFRFGKKQKK